MTGSERIRAIYDQYLDQYRQSEKKRRPGEGIFGLGNGPSKYPCHAAFLREMEAALGEAAGESLPSGEAREMLDFLFQSTEAQRDCPPVYWNLIATHGMTRTLIPKLAPSDREELAAWYEKTYPRRARLPVQDQVLRALKSGGQG